jgi:hypothetical protein
MIRVAVSLALAIGVIAAACRNDVPGPAIPTPVAPEVSRDAPRPKPIDPKKQRKPRKVSVSEVPQDAGVSDAVNLPPNPDAAVTVVRDAGQPLQ